MFISLLVCIAAALVSLQAYEVRDHYNGHRKVKGCDKINYKDYNKASRCCQQAPIGPVAGFDLTTILSPFCNNNEPFDPTYFYSYQVNKFQLPKNDYSINFANTKRVGKEMADIACIGYCTIKQIQLIKADGSVDDVALGTYFASFVPSAWASTVVDAVNACKTPMFPLRLVNVTYIEDHNIIKTCPVGPIMYIQCIQAYLIGRCPVSLQLASPHKDCAAEALAVDKCTSYFGFDPLFPSSDSN